MPKGRRKARYTINLDGGPCFINVLPNEIFAQIFFDIRTICLSDTAERGVPGWVVSITHTCSRWRILALNTRFLWTMVPRHISLAWQQGFVERSGNAPLELSLNLYAPDEPSSAMDQLQLHAALEMVRTTIRRMKILWLTFDTLDLYPDLSPVLALPAPMLRALQMNAVDDQGVELPFHLFLHDAPELISIDLENIFFTWPSLAFPSLRMLKINHTEPLDFDRSGMGTYHELLSLLGALPNLQLLELRGFVLSPPLDFDTLISSELASLPALRVLTLESFTQMAVLVLTHLNTPLIYRANLVLHTIPPYADGSLSSFINHLQTHHRAPLGLEIKITAQSLCFGLWMKPAENLMGYGSELPAPVNVEYSRPDAIPPLDFFLTSGGILIQAFDYKHLTALFIDTEAVGEIEGIDALDPNVALWISIFETAIAIVELGLRGAALPELCRALSLPAGRGHILNDGNPEPFLPSLQQPLSS
ncbi:hypothetical protein PENSPDRAFT_732339 [Peniophora sp. CONT]|nr:hypothetical protein PENSPDRAFT_732339 [Peniophora sp. CONT]